MKAVIMAGGKGMRLRPLTCNTPKPLQPLLNKPIIFYILELLELHTIESAILTLGYHGGRIESALADYDGLEVEFSQEEVPLGTAGGVLHAIAGYDGDVLVISGDAMCDFDLSAAIEFHYSHESDATIITKKVDDPREYGLVSAQEGGRITSFLEKPSYADCVSDIANTGIYIISQKALSLIPPNSPCDFAKDIFPVMLKRGMKLYSYEETGYWCDIGDIKSYMQCQQDMLNKRVKFKPSGARCGSNVTIGKNTKIDEDTIIGDDVTIGEGCVIKGSVLQNGCHIGDNVTISFAVCAKSCVIGSEVVLNEGSVIGAHAILLKGATVNSGVKVWDYKTVSEGVTLEENVENGFAKEITIDEDGITGQTNITITPSLCLKIGSGIASLKEGATIGLGYNHKPASKAFGHAVISGVLSAGETLWNFAECSYSQFIFCVGKSQVDFGVYVDVGAITTVRVLEKSGMPMRRIFERKLEAAINHSEYKKAQSDKMGTVINVESMSKLYDIELMKQCDASLDGICVCVKENSQPIRQRLEGILSALGCRICEDGMKIILSRDQKQVSLQNADGKQLFGERILAILCVAEFLRGEDVSLPYTAPKIIETLAEIHGRTVFHYCDCPCDDSDELARKKAVSKPYLRDGAMMVIKLLSFMAQNKLNFEQVCEVVPEFNVSSRVVSVAVNPCHLLKKLADTRSEIAQGVSLLKDGMTAYIKPVKSGKGILIYTQSQMNETAVEVGDFFEQIIKDTLLDS